MKEGFILDEYKINLDKNYGNAGRKSLMKSLMGEERILCIEKQDIKVIVDV